MPHLIDTSAWVEYLRGTEKGAHVRALLAREDILTSESTIGELVSWGIKEHQNVPAIIDVVSRQSRICDVYLNVWVEAAHAKAKLRAARPKLGIMDCILIALQQLHNATIVTADRDFKGLPRTMII